MPVGISPLIPPIRALDPHLTCRGTNRGLQARVCRLIHIYNFMQQLYFSRIYIYIYIYIARVTRSSASMCYIMQNMHLHPSKAKCSLNRRALLLYNDYLQQPPLLTSLDGAPTVSSGESTTLLEVCLSVPCVYFAAKCSAIA